MEQEKQARIPPKVTRENIGKYLMEHQLSVIGKTLEDTIRDDKWKFNLTITKAQHEEFRKYAIKLIKKTFKCNTQKATDTIDWFDTYLGLRIKG